MGWGLRIYRIRTAGVQKCNPECWTRRYFPGECNQYGDPDCPSLRLQCGIFFYTCLNKKLRPTAHCGLIIIWCINLSPGLIPDSRSCISIPLAPDFSQGFLSPIFQLSVYGNPATHLKKLFTLFVITIFCVKFGFEIWEDYRFQIWRDVTTKNIIGGKL